MRGFIGSEFGYLDDKNRSIFVIAKEFKILV
jgi:hypothetical protein